jgi:hypothetical protein
MQAPTTVRRLGEEHPRPIGHVRVTRGFGNEPGEFRDHRELLVPVESAGVGEHLNADMRVAAVASQQWLAWARGGGARRGGYSAKPSRTAQQHG